MQKTFAPCLLLGAFLFTLPLSAQNPPVVPVPAPGDPLYAPVVTSSTPQTFAEKFNEYAIVTFGPRAIFTPLIPAAIRMANPPNAYPREWKDGPGAFGRNYGDGIARETSMQTAKFLTGALLHEDFRYRPSTSKNAFGRSFHAIGFAFIDKSDSGANRIAIANFAGAAADGFVGNLYLPRGFNNVSHAETRMALSMAAVAGRNLAREFAPEIAEATRKLHIPFPRLPFPEWWVKR